MSEPNFFLTLTMVLGTVIAIFAMRYASSLAQARARISAEHSFKDVAERSLIAQAEITGILEDLKSRISRIEAILKEVE